MTKDETIKILENWHPWFNGWCNAELCGCMGKINCVGAKKIISLIGRMITKEEHTKLIEDFNLSQQNGEQTA